MRFIVLMIATILATSVLAGEKPPITLGSVPPVVVETVPVAGSDDVDPNLGTISVKFSKKMRDGCWSWVQMSKESFPTMQGQPRYLEDGRTNVLAVALKSNQVYAIWLNTDKFQNFVDEGGRAAVPYLLVFRTGNGKTQASNANAQ
jgi:RNA polymerase sigma-70 factor (ECF subfamily)